MDFYRAIIRMGFDEFNVGLRVNWWLVMACWLRLGGLVGVIGVILWFK
jgi:hypothetical protein